MTWLEVPEWRAWEPYAALMSDTHDIDTPKPTESDADTAAIAAEEAAEVDSTPLDDHDGHTIDVGPVVIVGELRIVDTDDALGADLEAGNSDADELDDDVPAPNDPVDPPEAFEDPADEPETVTYPEPERMPARVLPPPSAEATHIPPTAGETDEERARRIEKESMSRSERLLRGW